MKQIAFLLLIACMNITPGAQKTKKATLVFRGLQNVNGIWQLCFADKKNTAYCFNAKRSNTTPYVFYSTSVDGSLKENEKIKGTWFLVSYIISQVGKPAEKIMTCVEHK